VRRLPGFALVAAALLAGCGATAPEHGASTPNLERAADVASLRITRTPGLFILPPLDRTITDTATIDRLESVITKLPPIPRGAFACPIDFGTTYTLVFTNADGTTLTAVVSVLGCRQVKLSGGRVLWAVSSTSLYVDLAAALGLTQDELVPLPCPAPGRSVCYPQPTPNA